MKEPGLDNRHRDKDVPKGVEIQQKRIDALNKISLEPNSRVLSERDRGIYAKRNW